MKGSRYAVCLATSALALMLPATPAGADETAEGIARYREALADGNPAELWEMQGEELWRTARGPKNGTLEKCDLGQGPGVVKGAFVGLPRYFADTGRVQDLESRLLTCMETLQGIPADEVAKTPFGKGEQKNIEALVAWISAESRGMKFNVPMQHPEERRMYEIGKRVFNYRSGPHDFGCVTCHGEDGKRIRLQDLPNLTKSADAARGFGAWPAYRVSSGELWSMQRRLNDCFRQQRFPYPLYGSEVTVALSTYLGVTANGAGESTAPAIKR
ncbi:sulfur oxidation c-type cytochrome SoxA [Methyloversatilis thermotolerans]|uniref:sulfur oxidation c-type cytochrome SoxA n=1 Tax=Methyloversatilis thermotolerans TaxID=1346290 RepID=UPI00039DD43E|nr:sulfur oxidation c-type cytochrome SoxA [Methyloversatilis thermotolerans]